MYRNQYIYNHIRISFIASFGWKWTHILATDVERAQKIAHRLTPGPTVPKNLQETSGFTTSMSIRCVSRLECLKKILSNSCEVEKDIWKLKVVNFPARNPTTIDKLVVEEPIWNIRSWNRIDILGPQILRVWPWPYYLGWAEFFLLTLGGFHHPKNRCCLKILAEKWRQVVWKEQLFNFIWYLLDSLSCWWHRLRKS